MGRGHHRGPDAGDGPQAQAQDAPYRISPGDELSVTYPYNPELNLTGPVGPDGRFVVPMVGKSAGGGANSGRCGGGYFRAAAFGRDRGRCAARGVDPHLWRCDLCRRRGPHTGCGQDDAGGRSASGSDQRGRLAGNGAHPQGGHHSPRPDGAITQRVADLRAYAHHGQGTGIVLQSQDIVFVPRSSIAEADLWVDQHLNKLIPFSKSLNYSLGAGSVISR
jgi:hypothetical protein